MDINIAKLETLYGLYREAVLGIENGKIVYMNPAAQMLFPNAEEKKLESIIPSYLLEYDGDSFMGAMNAGGRMCSVAVCRLAELRILTVFRPESELMGDTARLLYSLAGELSGRLALIKMSSDLITCPTDEAENERLEKYVAILNRNYYSMLKLTNNMTQLSGLAARQTDVRAFDAVLKCRLLTDAVSDMASSHGVTITFGSTEKRIMLRADNISFEQLVLNLLSNSLKYTKSGDIIKVRTSESAGRLVLSVSDNGSGIKPEILSSVWNRYALEKDKGDPSAGVGMGLFIVQQIAMQYGGGAIIESRPGKGTIVTVSLPLGDEGEATFCDEIFRYGDTVGGLSDAERRVLFTELADVFGYEQYTHKFMD